ncbi:MAG: DegT/DnrJ/EryC1/StrS family aminotransferase [Blastocatellia bacterium]|nr:DegT/DnrJ/EryC1/StrS family aminotransferase [Blastocatellia bacterium]MCS7157049.1 DegT/DnrJ/EryC1/StrS family aminotransferase [Blastocatellia bacterium]MCX7752250.1 DegT/DnrJ/EryC1/StrS family aminotransferase [Blastocatellia bacterium]MDW8167742.1 DegT/DnrJ/EryC1/StrS family aminotransferase [Acidobacteriota bacterium]MDW8256790.1 DegT/DnrJ/EryC1/StrS family aminotransferase [Acidobacteriota bacterium]
MIRTIARYGVRQAPGAWQRALKALLTGQGVRGPAIREFEQRFAAYHGLRHAIATSYGRMAFYYILRALELPEGSEILIPAVTFWVVPEMAQVAGLRPIFVDVDPRHYTLAPQALARALTERTRAVVPTHLYGHPCDMEPILRWAERHDVLVIEDCAHALGATYRGRKVGTFGHAAFFSFQLLKGLNTYGGGMAVTDDDALAQRIRSLAEAEPWPSAISVLGKLLLGWLQQVFISPRGFTFTLFPLFLIASFLGDRDVSAFLWEKIRRLDPLPTSYRRRYSNAQALIGLAALEHLEAWNARTREHAQRLSEGLAGIPSLDLPRPLPDTEPVFYQYCIRVSDPSALTRRAIRRGVDIEMMHVDICSKLPLFASDARPCPVAETAAETRQLPVYSGLQPRDVERIIRVIKEISYDLPPLRVGAGGVLAHGSSG